MRRFTELYLALDATPRTSEKVAALKDYFAGAPEQDAALATWFLTGHRPKRALTTTQLREFVASETRLPLWLVEECYDVVGDLGETLSLLLDTANIRAQHACQLPLAQLVNERLLPLASLPPSQGRTLLSRTWRELTLAECFLFLKLLTGNFRVGVARTLLTRALAEVAGVDPAVMAHRLMGEFQPSVEEYRRLMRHQSTRDDISRPYPFFLAYQLDKDPAALGPLSQWLVERKWDGIRVQIIRRADQTLIWSRGEDLITNAFPEIRDAGDALPDGTVLDGELLGWSEGKPLPFSVLQHRLGRKAPGPRVQRDYPVAFLAYDLLERHGNDIRSRSLEERREQLETVISQLSAQLKARRRQSRELVQHDLFEHAPPDPVLERVALSPRLHLKTWADVRKEVDRSRTLDVEGVMLKQLDSAYGVGREKGRWWKWKADPLTIDAVLVAAQHGHGRRASLYTDYTFAVRDGDEFVTVAKAYSGLTDKEILRVDEFVRNNTLRRHGPVRTVRPELVFELAFEGVQTSSRHKSGLAFRFPRINRWRHDKKPGEADTLNDLKALTRLAPGT